jgi:hypothetical protein
MLSAHDRVALLDVVHRYAAAVDDRRLEEAAALFCQDGVLGTPEPPEQLDPVHEAVGRAAIQQHLTALDAIPLTFHAIVGAVFDGDASTATGRIACVAHHVIAPDTDLVWHLRYADSYRHDDDGWRIASRRLSIDLIETRSLKRSRGNR